MASLLFYTSAYPQPGLAAADRAASAVHGTVVLDTNETLGANTTVASPLIVAGGSIAQGTYSLSFSKQVIAHPVAWLSAAQAGSVRFAIVPPEFYPEWWGALADNVTDSTAGLNACATVLYNHGGVMRMVGYYSTTATIVFKCQFRKSWTVEAAGAYIRPSGAIWATSWSGSVISVSPRVRGLIIDVAGRWATGALGGFLIGDTGAFPRGGFEDCYVSYMGSAISKTYEGWRFNQVAGQGNYWTYLKRCGLRNDGGGPQMYRNVALYGYQNAVQILECNFDGVDGVAVIRGPGNDGGLSNSLVISENFFEGCTNCMHIIGNHGDSIQGGVFSQNRCEFDVAGGRGVKFTGVDTDPTNPNYFTMRDNNYYIYDATFRILEKPSTVTVVLAEPLSWTGTNNTYSIQGAYGQSFGGTISMPNIPASAGPSGTIWHDPTAGNVVKFVP